MAIALSDLTPAGIAEAGARTRPAPGGARRTANRRLGRRAHRTLLVAHVLSAVGWFGLAITVAFIATVGRDRGDVAFYEVIDATLSLSIPVGLAAAATGIALSLTTRWGVARHWWVVAKEVITVAAIATDVLVVGPEMADAIEAGRPGEIPGPVYAHCVILAIATVLSIVKPKARTPIGVRADAR
jgi:hypothetical protein